MALEQKGYLILIDDPSKIGKTVLCEAVIGNDKQVSMTGNDFKGEDDFGAVVAKIQAIKQQNPEEYEIA